ncbi:MAG: hypothetical protein KF723_11615 [Rhizobiaceae bacterium]|nr:hypothetical protein [Rhizobiaceae bacterium]
MKRAIAILALAAAVSGCARDDYQRIDGMTSGAGDAIAANTVMQMVDPWQEGVDDTRLKVPANRAQYTTAADTAEGASDGTAASALAKD